MPKNPQKMKLEGDDEEYLNIKYASEVNSLLGSYHTFLNACNMWKRECRVNKVHCKRKGLQHIEALRGFWTKQSWILDYAERLSRY